MKEIRERVKEIRERALKGDAEAQFQYAEYLVQEGVSNPDEVLGLFKSSASQGNYKAMTNLGIIYYFGDLGEQDYFKAFDFFENAARYHDESAYYYLGLSYQNGYGVGMDKVKGAEYMSKAARAGMPYAQLALGEFYEAGLGVVQDLYEATHWYAKAAKAGLEKASDRFNKIYYSTVFYDENGQQKLFWFEVENLKEINEQNKKDPFT